MAKACDHNIPETLKGAGPCEIDHEVRKRSGKPKWWCRTHGLDASAPDGNPLDRCSGAWFDPVPDEMRLELDVTEGEIAVWGVLPAALVFGEPPPEEGKVHVHRRIGGAGASKDIDGSYDIVTVHNGDANLTVEGMAAVAYSISEVSGIQVKPLQCPRCGESHIDELEFANLPHRKHQCNMCGRDFFDSDGPSVSNPLASAYEDLRLPRPPDPVRPDRPLRIASHDYSAIEMWPSNSAIISSMTRPEEVGVHVHAWDFDGNLKIDETYSPVTLDDTEINEWQLRALAVQRAVDHGPVISLPCEACGTSLLSPQDGWMRPVTQHTCAKCGAVTRTRRRSFLNPLAEKGRTNPPS